MKKITGPMPVGVRIHVLEGMSHELFYNDLFDGTGVEYFLVAFPGGASQYQIHALKQADSTEFVHAFEEDPNTLLTHMGLDEKIKVCALTPAGDGLNFTSEGWFSALGSAARRELAGLGPHVVTESVTPEVEIPVETAVEDTEVQRPAVFTPSDFDAA